MEHRIETVDEKLRCTILIVMSIRISNEFISFRCHHGSNNIWMNIL